MLRLQRRAVGEHSDIQLFAETAVELGLEDELGLSRFIAKCGYSPYASAVTSKSYICFFARKHLFRGVFGLGGPAEPKTLPPPLPRSMWRQTGGGASATDRIKTIARVMAGFRLRLLLT